MTSSSVSGKNWIFKKFNNLDVKKYSEDYSLSEIVAKLLAGVVLFFFLYPVFLFGRDAQYAIFYFDVEVAFFESGSCHINFKFVFFVHDVHGRHPAFAQVEKIVVGKFVGSPEIVEKTPDGWDQTFVSAFL